MKTCYQQITKDLKTYETTLSKIYLNQDILYNIMLNSAPVDVFSLSCISKIASTIYKTFWKEKFIIDYPFVKAKSIDWKEEYKQMYNASNTALNFTEVLLLMKEDEIKGKFICYSNYYYFLNNDINLNSLRCLPQTILNKLKDADLVKSLIFFQVKRVTKVKRVTNKTYRFIINVCISRQDTDSYETYETYRNEFINFVTLLFYNKPDITVSGALGSQYLYKDLVNLETDQAIRLLKYWENILDKRAQRPFAI